MSVKSIKLKQKKLPKKSISLSKLSETQILKLKLRSIPIKNSEHWFLPLIELVNRELSKRGILLKVKFWLSDEWFCPEGSNGIAIPFYLTDKKLMQLEKQEIGFVEGGNIREFIKILRHEMGHVIENVFNLSKHPLRVKHFGPSNDNYPTSYLPKKFSKKYVKHLPQNYAQSHSDEDFAETFAVWLTSKTVWQSKYKSWPALKKIKSHGSNDE